MKKNQIFRILFFVASFILMGIGLYLFSTTSRNLYTAIFLRAGFICFLFGCFWKALLRLPRWTDIGWLPIVAATIAWKPILLKFAIPTSILLLFLSSPMARGKYRPKSWRRLSSALQDVQEVIHNATNAGSTTEEKKEKKEENSPINRTVTKQEPKRNKREDIRGTKAKNVMFRAVSRVAGRQFGKMMKK